MDLEDIFSGEFREHKVPKVSYLSLHSELPEIGDLVSTYETNYPGYARLTVSKDDFKDDKMGYLTNINDLAFPPSSADFNILKSDCIVRAMAFSADVNGRYLIFSAGELMAWIGMTPCTTVVFKAGSLTIAP